MYCCASMNSLLKRIPLYSFLNNDVTHSRIEISPGVVSSTKLNTNSLIKYAPGAMLPAPIWRSANHNELDLIYTSELPKNYSKAVGLLKIPDYIMQNFTDLHIDRVQSSAEYYELLNTTAGKKAITIAENFIRRVVYKHNNFKIISVFNMPNLDATAYVPQHDYYMGLHVDYLAGQSIFMRDNTENRISINLGAEERYLLYINLTIGDILNFLNIQDECSIDSVVARFFNRYPDYPVIRLKINPGEAYIAPTQNLIHDGIGARNNVDLHLTICGHIDFEKTWLETNNHLLNSRL